MNAMNDEYAEGPRHVTLARCVTAGKPVEAFSAEEQKAHLIQAGAADMFKGAVMDSHQWLPFAAEKYKISAKLEDYVVVPVIIMPTGIPNANGVAFPFSQLSSFNPYHGMMAYNTWKGKPTHFDHQNDDILKAKGVVFDTAFKRLQGTKAANLWKVVTLLGFCREKDSRITADILAHRLDHYSMGSYSSDYICSVCGSSFNKSVPNEAQCDHYQHNKKFFGIYDGVLAFGNVINPVGFEVSVLSKTGAFASTWGTLPLDDEEPNEWTI